MFRYEAPEDRVGGDEVIDLLIEARGHEPSLAGAAADAKLLISAVMPIQLFVTCLVDGFAPAVGRACVSVLESLGETVEFPFDQTCCGQPAFNAGFRDDARAMAVHTVGILDATEGTIVVPSGSCADMIVHQFPLLLGDTPHAGAARRVAERTRELTQYLVDDLGALPSSNARGTAAVHRSCHGLRGLGLSGQIESLVDGIDGVERCELDGAEECCGFGGLFAIELPEVSTAILDTKIEKIVASGADTIVGGDVSCLMHIGGGLHRRGIEIETRHIAEMLVDE